MPWRSEIVPKKALLNDDCHYHQRECNHKEAEEASKRVVIAELYVFHSPILTLETARGRLAAHSP